MDTKIRVLPGSPVPFGASLVPNGVNFAVFSRHATSMTVALYQNPQDSDPFFEHKFDPIVNRTGDVWHAELQGIGAGILYGYRVDGPYIPQEGLRYNKNKLLIDPYARALTGDFIWDITQSCGYDVTSPEKDLSFSEIDNAGFMPKCIVIDDEAFDWQGDRPLNLPLRHAVIYELHVRGATRHASSGVSAPGTYQGIIEKIPYFKELGVTSLELLPVQEFDFYENQRKNPFTGEPLRQYWGYSTLAFFAPKGIYAASGTCGEQVTEFKTMVRELHKAGIEVILDVVFNHTAEGNELGPTVSFRGFDNSIWYMLDENPRYYKNFSGCGNTLNCNNPIVRNFIIDCLHYWVVQMHVDGFRFDLASILGRDQKGKMLENPPMIEMIAEDPILRNTKLIAEAWDAGGAYQVGAFPGGRWAEWNDRFRDDVRRYWRGDPGFTGAFATRITGSSDLYLRDGRKPFHSINYVCCHDGFTLMDLVSYNGKHNEENGENNFDGHPSNFSYNYGYEGPTHDSKILDLRMRQIKNFLTTLFLSLGTPMLLAGDEFGRTQQGNNNAWCQDNEISWINWNLITENAALFNFVKKLIAFRKRHPTFHRPEFYTGNQGRHNKVPDITWYNPDGSEPDWKSDSKCLAMRIDGTKADIILDKDDNDFFIIWNPEQRPVPVQLSTVPDGRQWYRIIDTSRPETDNFYDEQTALYVPHCPYIAGANSVVVLLSR